MKGNKKTLLLGVFLLLLYFFSIDCYPTVQLRQIYPGSVVGAPYANKHIQVRSEQINIKVDDFETARFKIRYTFQSDSLGVQIPFLFDLENVDDLSFKLDEKDVLFVTSDVYPLHLDTMTLFRDFYFPQSRNKGYVSPSYLIQYVECQITDALQHVLTVSFFASAEVSWWDYIYESRFSYNYTRHLLWSNFDKTETSLVIDSLNACEAIADLPQKCKIKDGEWYYEGAALGNVLRFGYSPIVTQKAKDARELAEMLIPYLIAILCIGIHLYFVYRFRLSKIKVLVLLVVGGSILVQLAIICGAIIGAEVGAMLVGPYGISSLKGDRFYYVLLIFTIPIYMFLVAIVATSIRLISRYKRKRIGR